MAVDRDVPRICRGIGGRVSGAARMLDHQERPMLGPYALTRVLEPCELAQRWLALHESDNSSHVAYRLGTRRHRTEQRRFLGAVELLAALDEPHILKIEQFALDQTDSAWVVCPFTGDADGSRTLGRLLREKGGQLSPFELEPALKQILQGVGHAHRSRLCHGSLSLNEILVDRHGRLIIELYGLSRALMGQTGFDPESARDEIRSVAEIGYQLLTGLRCEEPMIPVGRLVKRLDTRWVAWFDRSLDPTDGFDTADEALAALPSVAAVDSTRTGSRAVRGVLELIRPGRPE